MQELSEGIKQMSKKQLTITLSGPSGCGKTRTAAMLQYLFNLVDIEVEHASGDPVIDHDDGSGEDLMQWLADNIKIMVKDERQ